MFLAVLVSHFLPRIAIAWAWIFTDRIGDAFEGTGYPMIGLLIAPWTTLAYLLMWQATGLTGIGWLVILGGVFADLSCYGGSAKARTYRAPSNRRREVSLKTSSRQRRL